jgi:ribonuclease P protein component
VELGFPKSARLLRRAEFLAVQQKGQGFAEGPLAASWLGREPQPTRAGRGAVARVGLTVSSKVGESVVRNRVKRRLREAVRHELSALPAVDLVIVARASSVKASVDDFRAWLRRATARMVKGAGR